MYFHHAKNITSGEMELMVPIQCNLFDQYKFLIPMCEIRIQLTLASPEFVFMVKQPAGTDPLPQPKYYIKEASLYCRNIKASPAIELAHIKHMKSHLALYPVTNNRIKTFVISSGSRSYSFDNIFSGKVPSKLIAAFVPSNSYTGTYLTNPYLFNHFDLTRITLSINGEIRPYGEITYSFSDDTPRVLVGLYYFLLSMGVSTNKSHAIVFDRDSFKNKSFFNAFSLDSVDSSGDPRAIQSGNVRLSLEFGTPITEALTMIVFYQEPGMISISEGRQTLLDFAP
jgi:hypothetical protein